MNHIAWLDAKVMKDSGHALGLGYDFRDSGRSSAQIVVFKTTDGF